MSRPSGRSSADRLRRLRLVLTAVFTAANTVLLVVFAWLLLAADAREGAQKIDADLSRTTGVVTRLLGDDGGVLVTAAIDRDEISHSCPQFFVFTDVLAHRSGQECVPMDLDRLAWFAASSTTSGKLLSGYYESLSGGLVRFAVEPFRLRSGQYGGAVVAVADAEAARAEHRRVVLLVVLGCALAVGVIGFGGHVLSGRAIRPAAAALEQQEILLAETAHDLRTPVAALRALAETALRNPAERPELLPRTVRLAARMGGIIDGLLVRARLAAGVERLALQPVWLDQLVAGVVEETPSEGSSVTLTAAASKVVADPMLLQRAIGNLLDNALRYGRQPDQLAIVHITVADGRVTVADHGPGVDEALAEEVFDRFRTSSSGGTGASGLGLAIVRWVAQAHGGSLAVHNAEEGGAIFELTLPPAP